MSTTPPNRNPKRARQKEGAQARRAAEMAALKRQQRNRRMVRVGVFAVVVLAALLLVSVLGGDDDDPVASDDTTTTTAAEDTTDTSAALDVTPLTCEGPSGENTDLETKPTVTVPPEPATELTCQDLVVGDGDEVTSAGDTVEVHYVGVSQSTGVEFDASWGGDTAEFPLTGVINGWTEGIPGMKVGGRRVLTIPGDRAYGEAGRPPDIGPNDTLVFIIDLISVTKLGG